MNPTEKFKELMRKNKTATICGIIVLTGILLILLILLSEPSAKHEGATKETAMLVEVITPEAGSFRPWVTALGTVIPSRETILSPRVSGQVVEITEAFTPGGLAKEGEILLKLDASDFQNALVQRKGELAQAKSDLMIEMGRQNVAEEEFKLLKESIDGEMEKLVLRVPQLEAFKAAVDAKEAMVRQAELDLERTGIRAPFDAQILSRNAHVGSQVAPGDNLARLVGYHTYWVEATVPLSQLPNLDFESRGEKTPSRATVRNRTAWPEGMMREATLFKLIGELNTETRLARVLVAVNDPLALEAANEGLPPLMLGSFVETRIQAGEIKDVFRLKRDYVRSNDRVWVKKNDKLEIRPVNIVFRDNEYAYINEGLKPDEQVVITNLATVVEGALLRVKEKGQ